ncbi:MAG: dinitrogenase iron-molybdenum cofactor biosynthesis protein [Thermoplasmata archaeon]|nr:MAG: dinitrogenase iron-molybdenum cofactor biosynthesis protein [Thermoplasmata archaeon]RLF54973.1 MAG: dinitrogenase iron-molybdenum cofactor biosynthesis protein [Thermoplasmata archaeon]HDN50365.1 dinitrogenase iron-molybdenum cofactor biosynthesis protein [Thermoplasmatales archaeon]
MKVAFPTMGNGGMDELVGEHFGRVPTYTIVDTETEEVTVIPNTSVHMGGEGDPPEIMARQGVTAMICRGIGRKAIALFQELGIDVYCGAAGTVRDSLDAFKSGHLEKAGIGDACESHTYHHHHSH